MPVNALRHAALLLIASMAVASPRPAHAQDDWLGRDKALHFAASATLAGGGYGLAAALDADRGTRLAVGAGVALGAGVAKELWDLGGHGDPSWRDLTWDVIGTVTGLALSLFVDRVVVGYAFR